MHILVATAAMAASQAGKAEQACPWMTRGSAAKLLGGDTVAAIQIADDKQGSCNFVRSEGKATYTLDVAVGRDSSGACPEGSMAMKGIGNEARWCSLKRSSPELAERVSGRVRDAFFAVTLSTPATKNGGMSREMRLDILDQAAELVAGNLF